MFSFYNSWVISVILPMSRINLIRGVHYALLGYYPELKYDFLRRCSTGAGIGILAGGVINAIYGGDYKFVTLGTIVYGVARFFPRLQGYKEHWRFKE